MAVSAFGQEMLDEVLKPLCEVPMERGISVILRRGVVLEEDIVDIRIRYAEGADPWGPGIVLPIEVWNEVRQCS